MTSISTGLFAGVNSKPSCSRTTLISKSALGRSPSCWAQRTVSGHYAIVLPKPPTRPWLLIQPAGSAAQKQTGANLLSVGEHGTSPSNPVILAVVAGAAPEGTVLLVEINRRDRPGRFLYKI